MGRRGPPKKPTALKAKAGNPGGKRLDEREWKPPPGAPECPEFIESDPRALAVWRRLVPQLAAGGLATTVDGWVLARYCELAVRWMDAAAAVRAKGLVQEVRGAPTKKNPTGRPLGWRETLEVRHMRDLHRSLLLVEREFGLTPAARARIVIETGKKTGGGDLDQMRAKHFGLRMAQ